MFKTKKLLLGILLLVLLLPLWLWIFWLITPKRKMVVAIVDKTVLTDKAQEHTSLDWLLNNNKFSKTAEKLYHPDHDYFGFFPKKDFQYDLKGLERYSRDQLDQLSSDVNLTYFTDTYGIYKNEWYSSAQNTERSGIVYGGMSKQDVEFLELMKNKHKLILAEFNTIGSPTNNLIRNKFENLFHMRWTGWTARYFPVLDTVKDKELPQWLVNNYKKEHHGKWPFHNAGVAFVSSSDRVVIIEEGEGAHDAMTYIVSRDKGRKQLNLPEKIKYPFWFDIIIPDTTINTVAANFKIQTTAKGRDELKRNGIPLRIPAVIYHKSSDYQFYYFSGDFCDNPISMFSSYFKGVGTFSGLFYNSDNKEDRSDFFWQFYRPMLNRILNDHYKSIQSKE